MKVEEKIMEVLRRMQQAGDDDAILQCGSGGRSISSQEVFKRIASS